MSEENGRISISRDALRADLAEMELRLRNWIGGQLESKADVKVVLDLQHQVSDLKATVVLREGPIMRQFEEFQKEVRDFQEGNFSEAQKRTLQLMMDSNLRDHTDMGWTSKQRWIAVASLLISIIAVASSIILTLYYVG